MSTYDVTVHEVWPNDDDACIDLGEDEFILDAEFRSANRLMVAVASPQSRVAGAQPADLLSQDGESVTQCQKILDSGEQCGRDATDGEYCWQHS